MDLALVVAHRPHQLPRQMRLVGDELDRQRPIGMAIGERPVDRAKHRRREGPEARAEALDALAVLAALEDRERLEQRGRLGRRFAAEIDAGLELRRQAVEALGDDEPAQAARPRRVDRRDVHREVGRLGVRLDRDACRPRRPAAPRSLRPRRRGRCGPPSRSSACPGRTSPPRRPARPPHRRERGPRRRRASTRALRRIVTVAGPAPSMASAAHCRFTVSSRLDQSAACTPRSTPPCVCATASRSRSIVSAHRRARHPGPVGLDRRVPDRRRAFVLERRNAVRRGARAGRRFRPLRAARSGCGAARLRCRASRCRSLRRAMPALRRARPVPRRAMPAAVAPIASCPLVA